MKRDFDAAKAETFDLIVVGGGIVGAGIARDASLRGLKTLLLEKNDFACGTTSRSSRLIHGGLRYLRHLEFGLVKQDLREREILLDIAPHLVRPLTFVIPVSRESYLQRIAMPLGLLMYDKLYPNRSLPSHQRLSRRETLELEPNLEMKGLAGSYLYYDCQVPFAERLCLENILSAAANGACVLNHARVTDLARSGSNVTGVQVQDVLSGETHHIRARLVVNATGHWVDTVRGMLGSGAKPMVRRTKGIHLLTPRISSNAVVLFAITDRRLFFVIPWEGYSLIGTTDTDYSGDLDTIESSADDVAYLLGEVQLAFPATAPEDIFYASAGLRALADPGGRRASDVSRSHRIMDHKRKDGIGGLVSVLGGKITAYRAVAEETVDLVCRKLRHSAPCTTADTPLPGAPAVPEPAVRRSAEESGLTVETVANLAALYGSRFSEVVSLMGGDAEASQPLCGRCSDVLAQVRHAVEEEMAMTVGDFLLRRSVVGLGPGQGLDATKTVARDMGRRLGWGEAERQRQVDAYRATAALGQRFRSGPSSQS